MKYGDDDAARLTKWAKHDPETASVVHAARRLAPDVTIHTKRWGKPGAGRIVEQETEPENGSAWTVRGLYQPKTREIDVHYNADGNATLAHELVHHVLATRGAQIGGRDEEDFADYASRQDSPGWRKIPDRMRHKYRDEVVELLGKDIRRGNDVDLTQRPDGVARLNAKTAEERRPVSIELKRGPARAATSGRSSQRGAR